MPLMFWNAQTDMNCIQHIARRVLNTGYANHIERLMVICNFCLLAGIDPYEVSVWFLSCFVDAYDWVVVPNIVGMGMNSDDGYTATRPYIASANYINKMSEVSIHKRSISRMASRVTTLLSHLALLPALVWPTAKLT
ncbi:hypothetical protein [Dictyobacter formicarum]|uniref:Uncharacterized protein n=1 Tax=Dictyobacter formicarum TaxID=2778368 RepID=A0ABQ3VP15_9CHLR|nr:hypothetical protein [Dictyobacter formicarum]GHO87424.1 hypothetical protein KSZ_54300 [Dictyobacter formicarum]